MKCHVAFALHCIDTTGLFVGGELGLLRRWHGAASDTVGVRALCIGRL